jgi:hypothetical protein
MLKVQDGLLLPIGENPVGLGRGDVGVAALSLFLSPWVHYIMHSQR